jgi:hypothetical protein
LTQKSQRIKKSSGRQKFSMPPVTRQSICLKSALRYDASTGQLPDAAVLHATRHVQAEAIQAYEAVDLAHTSSGQRVDILMSKALVHLFAEEYADAKTAIDAANT